MYDPKNNKQTEDMKNKNPNKQNPGVNPGTNPSEQYKDPILPETIATGDRIKHETDRGAPSTSTGHQQKTENNR